MTTNRYKAVWTYSQCCLRKGQVVAECESDSLPEFAKQLVTTYAYNLGDGFSHGLFESEKAIKDCYGEALPEWFNKVTTYPVHVFTSNFGEEILCNPSASAIINQVRGESYGDYDLKVTGV